MTGPGQKRETTKPGDHKDGRKSQDAPPPETSRVLQVKRWEVHEGPFRGFNSPPGRF